MKQVLKSSLMSLSVWTGRVKEVVKSLDERIDSLTQKVSNRSSMDVSSLCPKYILTDDKLN